MKQSTLYTPRDIFAHAREESEIGSLLNTDMYKFMMLDFIIAHPEYKDLTVQREMKIRSQDVKTKNVIPMEALKEQLEACRQMRGLSPVDISYLR
jgi:nicotinic acid phosphoribosyltransferase